LLSFKGDFENPSPLNSQKAIKLANLFEIFKDKLKKFKYLDLSGNNNISGPAFKKLIETVLINIKTIEVIDL